MNIVSIFAGRKANIEILKKYMQKALELNIIDEVHFWNYTRNSSDEDYLKTISNLKRTSSFQQGNFISIAPILTNNSFELNIKAPNDIHIVITNLLTKYKIVLGGWNNTKSVIKENDTELCSLLKNNVADGSKYNNFKIVVEKDMLHIKKNYEDLISQKVQNNFEIKNIYFKTGHGSVGHLTYNTVQNNGFYFMDTCEKKSWKNYYNYYNDKKFENDIILKCDDDIVFIDLAKFPKFIEFIKNNNYDLVFANTINNGVSAYFQQNKYNLIPKEHMHLEYPENGFGGSLWKSGSKAENLHNYFIENYKKFLDCEYDNDFIIINSRFSINFFGFKGKNWYKLIEAHHKDDEHALTVEYVKKKGFKNVLYSDFYVSHLSFFKQLETKMNLSDLIFKYHALYCAMEENGRFK